MALPKVGVRLDGGMAPSACVEFATLAERSGFAAIWFAENPFQRGVLPAVAACLVRTERIVIGIGVFNPSKRPPTPVALGMGPPPEAAPGRPPARLRPGDPPATAGAWVRLRQSPRGGARPLPERH